METIRMSRKELKKEEIIAKVFNGQLTQKKASEELNMSLRQVKRLCKKYKEKGIEGLVHKNREKPSNRRIGDEERAEVYKILTQNYIGFGPQLTKEQLEERHQMYFSREWVRTFMIKEGLWKARERKSTHYYQRRNRRDREGELLQIDGSPHCWFEDRGPKCCLINMVDDATGKIMECQFVKEECLEGYFDCMKRYLERYGRPVVVYTDRHTIFKSPKEEKNKLTQFGRALKELEIKLIHANSPQAKGRVERSHGTLQDRLIKLMRLEGISTMEEGNKYLERFCEDYNRRFGKPAANGENAHRSILVGQEIGNILCRKEERKVTKALEVQYKNVTYQIISKTRRRLEGVVVLMIETKNGIVIESQGKKLEYKIYSEQPYEEHVLDRKRLDAFLDRKKPMTIKERLRKKIAINF